MKNHEQFVGYVYDIVKLDCEEMDAIYKDYILQLVGVYGFNALYGSGLLESCGTMHGRGLYVLFDKPEGFGKDFDELLEENEKLKKMILRGF